MNTILDDKEEDFYMVVTSLFKNGKEVARESAQLPFKEMTTHGGVDLNRNYLEPNDTGMLREFKFVTHAAYTNQPTSIKYIREPLSNLTTKSLKEDKPLGGK